jgi:hypothetical protein
MKTWKVILATALIFLTGTVTGVQVGKRLHPRQAPFVSQRLEVLRRMEGQLDLSRQQRDRIGEILREGQERMAAHWEQIRPKVQNEFRQVRDSVRAELNAEQRRRFDELLRQSRAARRGTPARSSILKRWEEGADQRSRGKAESNNTKSLPPSQGAEKE